VGDIKKFDKYKRYGAYHWMWYDKKPSYRENADFLKGWIKEKDVIEIGAGDGFIVHHLGIKGIDNDSTAVQLAAEKKVKVDEGDAYDLPYDDKEFECALMTDTVEHFKDVNIPLSQVRRIIRKYLYINIPARERFEEPDHYHKWTPKQFINEVTKNGFTLEEEPISKNKRHYFKFRRVDE